MTRLEIFLAVFGWQGGTIHEVAEATGCKSSDLLHAEPDMGWQSTAYHIGRVNGSNDANHGTHRFIDPATGRAFPHTFGRLQYWLGVADGYMEASKGVA